MCRRPPPTHSAPAVRPTPKGRTPKTRGTLWYARAHSRTSSLGPCAHSADPTPGPQPGPGGDDLRVVTKPPEYRLDKIEVLRSDGIDQIRFVYDDGTVWYAGTESGKQDLRVRGRRHRRAPCVQKTRNDDVPTPRHRSSTP